MADFRLWIPRMFLISAAIAIITCLQRADFNLPLFVFAWLVWTELDRVIPKQSERPKLVALISVSLFADAAWLVYWGTTWGAEDGA